MTFQPGQVSNPKGRIPGSRNRRTQQILDLIQGRGDKDPLDALSEIITTSKDPNIIATASNILAPYLHSKKSTTAAPRFVPELIEVPSFQSIDEAENFLNSIATRLGLGEVNSQSALEINTLVKTWINSRRADQELQLKIEAQGGGGDQTIHISGGLPELPGTSVIFDETAVGRMNGHTNGHVIDHEPTAALKSKAKNSPMITKD